MILSGKIYKQGDYDGLADVNISEVGTANSTRTDQNGNFTLAVTSGLSKIRFSRIDLVTKEILASSFNSFENLEPATTELPETTVTTWVKKQSLTPIWVAIGLIGAFVAYNAYQKNQPKKVKV